MTNFHISWPSRVNHLGDLLSNDVRIERYRRSISSYNSVTDSVDSVLVKDLQHTSSAATDAVVENEAVHHFTIEIHPEKIVTVQVKQANLLLSPSALVERKVSKFKNISDSRFSTLGRHYDCHFTGHVLNEDTSRVALSACGGLVSRFVCFNVLV